jgi:hypothetical protein
MILGSHGGQYEDCSLLEWVEEYTSLAPPERWYRSTQLCGITSQKIIIFKMTYSIKQGLVHCFTEGQGYKNRNDYTLHVRLSRSVRIMISGL